MHKAKNTLCKTCHYITSLHLQQAKTYLQRFQNKVDLRAGYLSQLNKLATRRSYKRLVLNASVHYRSGSQKKSYRDFPHSRAPASASTLRFDKNMYAHNAISRGIILYIMVW